MFTHTWTEKLECVVSLESNDSDFGKIAKDATATAAVYANLLAWIGIILLPLPLIYSTQDQNEDRFCFKIASWHAPNANLTFDVSVAVVTWMYSGSSVPSAFAGWFFLKLWGWFGSDRRTFIALRQTTFRPGGWQDGRACSGCWGVLRVVVMQIRREAEILRTSPRRAL